MIHGQKVAALAVSVVSIAACRTARPPEPPAEPAVAPLPAPQAHPVPRIPQQGFVDVDGASLWYRIEGNGPDTVLVFPAAYLEPFLPLGQDRFTLVWYDPRLRGRSRGATTTPRPTFQSDLRDLEAVADYLGAGRVSLVAFGYDAAVAVAFAAAHPDRVSRLVLLSPLEPRDSLGRSYDPPERSVRLDTARARTLVKLRAAGRDTSDPQGYCRAFWEVNAPLFAAAPERLSPLAPWCEFPAESPANLAGRLANAIESLGRGYDLGPWARSVTSPTLIVAGERDLVYNPAGAALWAALLPRGRALLIPGVGHLAFAEAADTTGSAVVRFLGGEWPAGALRPPASARE